ncbi:conjugative transfer ATPase [Polaromonas sp.]|uniref:conjugative transfer ATPase n=1 Tax=Polaromonas sp. TaxID=1869339 RepID=UPI002BB66BF2|nr:conjugative transfer ATPase [Polaromonas sp.]HQS89216.1 conjugative transfer ATPase [Polaromonas sp.]
MRWKLPWPKLAGVGSSNPASDEQPDSWQRHVEALRQAGIPEPGSAVHGRKPATLADEQALYDVAPSFVELLPWVEFMPESKSMLLEDGQSVAAFFELVPLGTEGREPGWLAHARDALENALQDSFDELDENPWVLQLYAQDEPSFDQYMQTLRDYVQPRARGSAFTEFYLRFFGHHMRAVAKPGGLFEDTVVTRLRWRGQTRRVRMVVYRRASGQGQANRRGQTPEQMLGIVCDRLCGGLANAGIQARRMVAADVHDWLLRWFNPRPTLLGPGAEDRERFYSLARYPDETEAGEIELASGRDFSQRLFFGQPRSDVAQGAWYFDGMPHRVLITDRLRMPPGTGHLTGETRKGDAINTLFDQMPEDTLMCLTMVATPQDVLESDLNHLAKKAVGETLASEQTLKDVHEARSLIGSAHKLYRGTLAFYLRGRDEAELDRRGLDLANVMLNAGLQPVREDDEVAPLNSYLRWLPCCYNPGKDRRRWYTQLMFAQHAANLSPVWGRAQGTGHPGITMFNRGGGPITFDPLNRLDRQMNAHLFLFGPTGSGKSATLNNLLNQVTAIYRPRLFIVEAGNSFGLFSDFARRLGLTVNRVKLAPGSGISLAPFADARRLIETPSDVQTLDADALDEDQPPDASAMEADEQRDVLGELEITARLMITGGEDKEEARMTRADRSLIRQCILDAAISLISTVNNIAERDQYLGRPIVNVTDEGHIITKNPLLAPYVVKITKMWRKLGAWFWLATQNIDDLPRAAEPMLNMIEWWVCLSMPPDEVEKIARFRELSPAQKALMLSARKEAGKFTEGVILSKSMEVLFRAVPPSLYLALAQTEPEEKAERYQLMQQHGVSELDAAFKVAEKIDRARGIESPTLDLP